MFNQKYNDMVKSKFKVGDKVRIVSNELQPQYVGKEGVVKKAYESFTDENAIYRIQVGGETLRGVALDSDIEAYD